MRARLSGMAARYGGHRRPVLEPHETDLRRLVETTPDLTLAELQTELQRRCGLRAGFSTIHNALRRIGLRHKKSGTRRPSRTAPRRRPTPALAGLAALHGSLAVRLPRRDRDRHQHDPALRPQPLGPTPGRRRAARPLAHHDLHRRPQADRPSGAVGARRADDRDRFPRLRNRHRLVIGFSWHWHSSQRAQEPLRCIWAWC